MPIAEPPSKSMANSRISDDRLGNRGDRRPRGRPRLTELAPEGPIDIHCPECGSTRSRVINTRGRGGLVRRQRKCLNCRTNWFTIEVPETIVQRWSTLRVLMARSRDALTAAIREIDDIGLEND
jgi:hypothetical protein